MAKKKAEESDKKYRKCPDCILTKSQLTEHTPAELILSFMYGTLVDINKDRSSMAYNALDRHATSIKFVSLFDTAAIAVDELIGRNEHSNPIDNIARLYDTFSFKDTLKSIIELGKDTFGIDLSTMMVRFPDGYKYSNDNLVDEYFIDLFKLKN